MSSNTPSPELQARILRALEAGRLTTAAVAARVRVSSGTASDVLHLLRLGGLVKRSILRHWRRTPKRGWAEWVWRLP